MTSRQLETLLLDRALGALDPEVAALLDLHLAQDPEAAQRAADLAAALQLARAAVASPVETPRPLDQARLHRARSRDHARVRRREFLRLAACVAAGLGLGWVARPAHVAVDSTAVTAALARPSASAPATQFWSIAHLVPEAAKFQPPKKL
jgi:anti-sigma factor RsiW